MPSAAVPDVILIGGGIMSAHVGTLLKSLDPRLSIHVLEAAGELAREGDAGRHCLAVVEAIDEADAFRLLCSDGAAGHDHFERARFAD